MTSEEIKAIRMKLAAKKPGGRFKGKSSIGGTYRSVKPFNEQLHPRGPGGKFASKPGGGIKPSGGRKFASREERARQQASDATHGAGKLPPKKYKQLREKLGLSQGGKDVPFGKVSESRLARAKELRAARAAKQAKPSLKEQAAAHRAKKGDRETQVSVKHAARHLALSKIRDAGGTEAAHKESWRSSTAHSGIHATSAEGDSATLNRQVVDRSNKYLARRDMARIRNAARAKARAKYGLKP